MHQTFTDPFVKKYLWYNETIPLQQTEEIMQTNDRLFASQGWGLWKIMVKPGLHYAGFAGLWTFFNEPQPQLLYGLLPENTGFGYATEASAAIIHHAFHRLGFSYLTACFDEPNTASEKVCERLHMHPVEERMIHDKPVVFYRIDQK